MSLRLSVAMWPLVVVSYPPIVNDADWTFLFEGFDRLYERRERFCILNDAMILREMPSASMRLTIGHKIREHEPRTRRWVIGGAVAFPSPLARGALMAITWLAPPACPLSTHRTSIEAMDACVDLLEKAGAPVPILARRFRSDLARRRIEIEKLSGAPEVARTPTAHRSIRTRNRAAPW